MFDKREDLKHKKYNSNLFFTFIGKNWKIMFIFILLILIIIYPIQISNILADFFNDFFINFIKHVNWNLK